MWKGISKNMCKDCLLGTRLEFTIYKKRVIDGCKFCSNFKFFWFTSIESILKVYFYY